MTQVLSYREEHFQVTDKVGVVIPVYGESDSIVWVLNHFPKGVVDTICLVVDVPIRKIMNRIRGAAEQSAIMTHIIKNPERMGVGLSILQGLEYLRKTNHSIAVVMAGNGKDDPRQIARLTKRPGGAPWTRAAAAVTAAPLDLDWTERGVVVCG